MTKAKPPKATSTSQQSAVTPRYRFWVTMACIATLIFWYVLTIFMSIGIGTMVAKSEPRDAVDQLYELLIAVQAFLPFIAGLLTAPFSYWVFRQLNVKRAGVIATAVAMTPAVALYVFMFIYSLFPAIQYPVNGTALAVIFFVSGVLSVGWTIWLVKRGQAFLSERWEIVVAVAVPFIIIGINYVGWLLVTGQY